MIMATATGTFESVIGAYFDDTVTPKSEETRLTERGAFIQKAANSPSLIHKVEKIYGVTII